MNVKITSLTFRIMYNRTIAFCNIIDENGNILKKDSLSNCIQYCNTNSFEIENTLEVLTELVVKRGIAS